MSKDNNTKSALTDTNQSNDKKPKAPKEKPPTRNGGTTEREKDKKKGK